jgi:hypothetical protein
MAGDQFERTRAVQEFDNGSNGLHWAVTFAGVADAGSKNKIRSERRWA